MACGTLTAGFTVDCSNPMSAGLDDVLRIFNYDDIAEATITNDGTDDLGIKSIVLPTGQTGFDIQTFRQGITALDAEVDVNGVPRYRHQIGFYISKDDVAANRLIDTLNKGTFVVGIYTRSKQIRLYGLESGLESVAQDQRNYAENSGFALITLASREGQEEPRPPANFLGSATTYDYAAARAEFEVL